MSTAEEYRKQHGIPAEAYGGKGMKKNGNLSGKLAFVTAIGLIVAMAGSGVAVYYGSIYQVDRANAWIDLASASNNLSEVLYSMNQSLVLLAPYHGNPNLLFPQPRTDFDNIRAQIQATIATGLKVLNATPDSFAYEQALKNIQSDLTTTIQGELNDAGAAMWYWQWGVWLWGGIPLTSTLFVFGLWRRYA